MPKLKAKQIWFWVPRGLAIAFTVFISIFALDVFTEGYSFGETLIALFMHLIPTFILIAATWIAWKWENIGGPLFIILGLVAMEFFSNRPLNAFIIIAMPLFIIGVLFTISENPKRLLKLASFWRRRQSPTK